MSPETIKQFIGIVGPQNALTKRDDLFHYTRENRGLFVGETPLVLKPGSAKDVSDIMKLASRMRIPIVPQGGHTGHVGGAVADETGEQITLSMERMNRVREVDLNGNVLVCEAGCILETIQELADEHDRLFPLALGSQGSCQIGGNISTNAGGTGVLAYGNTRQLVMGLEVVLPSGDIWRGLRRLKKDNTGYDLKDLFIGAEGTLGVITAAVLKLFPKPRGKAVALCAMRTTASALALLKLCETLSGTSLTAFEFMVRDAVEATAAQFENVRIPLLDPSPWYVLMEFSSTRSTDDAQGQLETILQQALEEDIITDAALAANLEQQSGLWRLRENMPLAQKGLGGSMKHDISIPIHKIPEFLKQADRIIETRLPGATRYTFGHLGDGNIHYNISQPAGADKAEFLARQTAINDEIHDLVAAFEGSVAAEHGVGRLKRDLIARTKDPVELSLMKSIKQTLDPLGIMNPGKVIQGQDC